MADLTDAARRNALAIAYQLRANRAWLEESVASGAMTLDGLFEEQDAEARCDPVKVVVLAQKVPGVGKVRSRRAMEKVGIAEDARFGEVDRTVLRALWSEMAAAAARPL
jgi:hypothetical protein